jgi:hypothetical protein
MTTSQQKTGTGGNGAGHEVGSSHWGLGLGAYSGGCSDADDALPDRGYTIHVVSLRELAELLQPEGHRRGSDT